MSTEWTTERLEALHEGTSVAIWDGGSVFTKDSAGNPDRPWAFSRGGRESSAGLLRESQHPDTGRGWIRVVSVPVELIAKAVEDYPYECARYSYDGYPIECDWKQIVEEVRDAIGHVTGS